MIAVSHLICYLVKLTNSPSQEFTVALYKNRSPRPVDMTVFTQTFTSSAVFQPFSASSSHHQVTISTLGYKLATRLLTGY